MKRKPRFFIFGKNRVLEEVAGSFAPLSDQNGKNRVPDEVAGSFCAHFRSKGVQIGKKSVPEEVAGSFALHFAPKWEKSRSHKCRGILFRSWTINSLASRHPVRWVAGSFCGLLFPVPFFLGRSSCVRVRRGVAAPLLLCVSRLMVLMMSRTNASTASSRRCDPLC